MPIRLGPFALHRPIGQGGMGDVWLGEHVGQSLPVAVKLVRPARLRDPSIRTALLNEVRAVAGLDHPGVVMVFDYGQVDADAARRSDGSIEEGCPYLVMELLSGGSLADRPPPGSWPALRDTLLDLLDALAYAHARGVVHRDLKPNNVLMGTATDTRPGLKLIDFGLAATVLRGLDPVDGVPAGTPAYEAPEKVTGAVRDQGPWTDLYGLGCLAYALAAGHPPFQGNDHEQLLRCHLLVPVPPLEPRIAVPVGFEGWLLRLLAKNPVDRYHCAADAAYGLRALEHAPMRPVGVIAESIPAAALGGVTQRTRPIVPTPRDLTALRGALHDPETPGADREEPAAIRLPPVPESWHSRRREISPHSMRLVGDGLGIYGLRPVPMVGRHQERQRLWNALGWVRKKGRARVVLLHGAAGNGKSRLVQWLAERASELGGVPVLESSHSPMPSPDEGIPRMLQRYLRCTGLSYDETVARRRTLLLESGVESEFEWLALARLMRPSALAEESENERLLTLDQPADRYAPLMRFIAREAAQRGAIVWLDDVQWGADSIAFVEYVLRRQEHNPTPVMFLLTAREEDLPARPDARNRLRALMDLPECEQISVPPLSRAESRTLVRGLLGLEGELAAAVEARCGGNPLFAVQLVGDWVRRGVLEVGAEGFVLSAGERATVPDDIHDLWRTRVLRAVEGLGAEAEVTLEIAAALGVDVEPVEWSRVCARAGLAVAPGLVERLVENRLAVVTDGGWRFVHGMLRESLDRMAAEAGRLASHHRACARVLEEGAWGEDLSLAERFGRHLLAAGEYREAIDPLLLGARGRQSSSAYAACRALLDQCGLAMRKAEVPPHDEVWGDVALLRARSHAYQGNLGRAEEMTLQIMRDASRHGWDEALALARHTLGYVEQQRGHYEEARRHYAEALSDYRKLEHPIGEARCLVRLGELARLREAFAEGTELVEEALEIYRDLDHRRGESLALRTLGTSAFSSGDLSRAAQLLHQSLAICEEDGDAHGGALCRINLAEIDSARGNYERARRGFFEAVRLYRRVGSRDAAIAEIRLGAVLVRQGMVGEGREAFDNAVAELESTGRRRELALAELGLLACEAVERRWDAWRERWSGCRELLLDHLVLGGDAPFLATVSAEAAMLAGQSDIDACARELLASCDSAHPLRPEGAPSGETAAL